MQASATLRTNHCRKLIPPRTPEARVATELSLRARTLREQYPGARAQVPHQKDAHIERRPRPHRMDDGVLAYANKAEAVTTRELKLAKQLLLSDVRTINSLVDRVTYSWHVLVRLPFSRNFHSHEVEKWEARNSLQRLRTRSLPCPPWTVLRNWSKTDDSIVNAVRVWAKKSMLIT